MELSRFANCFIEAKPGDLFPKYYWDNFHEGAPVARAAGELYFNFDNLFPRPQDSDEWVLNRWGIRWVACKTEIEVLQEEIKLKWLSGYAPALQIYADLARLFPRLKMKGDYCELQNCFGGEVFCFGGKFTHVDTTQLIEAEMEAFYAERQRSDPQEQAADEVPF